MPQGPDAKRMKLSEDERAEKLEPLLNAGWSKTDGRDAIEKKFQFKDFNQVRDNLFLIFSFMNCGKDPSDEVN